MSSCVLKPQEKQPSINYLRDAKVILSPFVKQVSDDDKTLEVIFSGFKETSANPGIPRICKDDVLIREFAKSLVGRLGEENERIIRELDNIRTKIRTVGRLLKELNEEKEHDLPLTDFIVGTRFYDVVAATKSLSIKADSPQIALVLGHYIKHIALLKISLGIQTGSPDAQNEGREFQYMFQAHWNNAVSSVAKRRQRLRQLNKPDSLPLTEDLVRFKSWLTANIQKQMKNRHPDDNLWTLTAQMVMIRITTFNKRRIAEVEEMKVADFLRMESQSESYESDEIANSLDITERALLKRFYILMQRLLSMYLKVLKSINTCEKLVIKKV